MTSPFMPPASALKPVIIDGAVSNQAPRHPATIMEGIAPQSCNTCLHRPTVVITNKNLRQCALLGLAIDPKPRPRNHGRSCPAWKRKP